MENLESNILFSTKVLTSNDLSELLTFFHVHSVDEIGEDSVRAVLSCPWLSERPNIIGYGLFASGQLIGYIGSINHKEKDLKINDLSWALISSEFRGRGLAKLLFIESFSDGDVVLDLTPTELVYQMIEKHIPGLEPLSDYQYWFSPRRFGKKDCEAIFWKKSEVSLTDSLQKIVDDHKKTNVHFVFVGNEKKPVVIGYVKYAVFKGKKAVEILFCSDKTFFSQHCRGIFREIGKKESCNLIWCDSRFLPSVILQGPIEEKTTGSIKKKIMRMVRFFFRPYLKVPNRKVALIRNQKGRDYLSNNDYLYSEFCFY